MSVPTANRIVIDAIESELSLLNSSIPSTLLSCSSCSSIISRSTSCGLAPGQERCDRKLRLRDVWRELHGRQICDRPEQQRQNNTNRKLDRIIDGELNEVHGVLVDWEPGNRRSGNSLESTIRVHTAFPLCFLFATPYSLLLHNLYSLKCSQSFRSFSDHLLICRPSPSPITWIHVSSLTPGSPEPDEHLIVSLPRMD